MAKRKRTRKRTRSMGELGKRKSAPRRRRHTRKKGMLSELMNKETATASAKNVLSGAIGGFAVGFLDAPTKDMQPAMRTGVFLGASFLASSVLKMPAIGAGIAGAYGLMLSRKFSGLSEYMSPYEYANQLDEEPEYMDEDGNEMFLADDGQFYYMDEVEGDENLSAQYLADRNYTPQYSPPYA